jgi:dTDP-4-dehydrorhamnose 3,5-epimerase
MGSIKNFNILVTPLKRIKISKGDVMHVMKKKDDGCKDFSEAYFSWISNKSIKAWKYHSRMTMNLVVPFGQVRFVFYKKNKYGYEEFQVEEIGVRRYARLTVPPGLWFGFKGLYSPKSLILNISNVLHDEKEVKRINLSAIKYNWNQK